MQTAGVQDRIERRWSLEVWAWEYNIHETDNEAKWCFMSMVHCSVVRMLLAQPLLLSASFSLPYWTFETRRSCQLESFITTALFYSGVPLSHNNACMFNNLKNLKLNLIKGSPFHLTDIKVPIGVCAVWTIPAVITVNCSCKHTDTHH